MQGKLPWLVCLVVGSLGVPAGASPSGSSQSTDGASTRDAPGMAVSSREPDLAFLEYLGDLVEEDGQWLGPEEMDGLMKDQTITRDENVNSSEVRR